MLHFDILVQRSCWIHWYFSLPLFPYFTWLYWARSTYTCNIVISAIMNSCILNFFYLKTKVFQFEPINFVLSFISIRTCITEPTNLNLITNLKVGGHKKYLKTALVFHYYIGEFYVLSYICCRKCGGSFFWINNYYF